MGRVVITHSTYIKGLIQLLKELAKNESIKTISPGEIKKARGRVENLTIRVSKPILGGFKLIARRGTSIQEVFVITQLDKTQLEQRVIEAKSKSKIPK